MYSYHLSTTHISEIHRRACLYQHPGHVQVTSSTGNMESTIAIFLKILKNFSLSSR